MTVSTRPALVHRLAIVVAGMTLLMIGVGAFVTSRDAGLSIPDGVSNHGAIVPAEQIREGYVAPSGRAYSGGDVLSEFAHRGVGWPLGLMTIGLAILLARRDSRPWVRKLGFVAVLLVAAQGALGALGVELRQPTWLVIPHAFLAQAFLSTVVTLAYATSEEGLAARPFAIRGAGSFHRAFVGLAVLAGGQLVLGAAFRHADSAAALALHVAVALLLVLGTAWQATRAQGLLQDVPTLARGVTLQGGLLLLQVFLGFLAWLARRPKNSGDERGAATHLFPTAHVLLGALLLAGFVLLAWRSRRLLAEPAARPETDRAAIAAAAAAR